MEGSTVSFVLDGYPTGDVAHSRGRAKWAGASGRLLPVRWPPALQLHPSAARTRHRATRPARATVRHIGLSQRQHITNVWHWFILLFRPTHVCAVDAKSKTMATHDSTTKKHARSPQDAPKTGLRRARNARKAARLQGLSIMARCASPRRPLALGSCQVAGRPRARAGCGPRATAAAMASSRWATRPPRAICQ